MSRAKILICVIATAAPLLAACGDDSSGSSTTTGAAGASAGGSSSAGASGSNSAGAGGAATAGAGGAVAGGASGAAGSSSALVDLAGCTEATAADKAGGAVVTAGVGGPKYAPACVKIKVGDAVEFKGTSSIHPLVGMSTAGTQPNPIGPSSTSDKTVTFTAPGTYGYFCENHGADGSSSGMVGAVYVAP